ncbi:MAG: hypothetical protein OEW64_11595 [Gammaproteobacteria bacterium]|nr:hypothetical protein [Gammaproteobacteria bacterium]MDH5304723.1 hypothetical protein [Gammaproteobacteria bacterium]MDH5321170.1 hypothetical protein [Gammaproteobacteria bacterium]
MPSVAAWLLARPLNAGLALAMTMLMPGLATVSGAILVLLVVQQDLREVLLTVALAGLALLIVGLVSGGSPVVALIGIVTFWLPVLVLARILRITRSLTLALQASVIVALIGTGAFFALHDNPVEFWQDVIAANSVLQSLRLTDWQAALAMNDMQFAGVMTTLFAIGFWFGLACVILLGYWLYQQLPGKSADFGRFCELNFGYVIALLLAVSSIAGFAFNVVWIQSIAVLLFAVFWLQGAALVHWLHASGFVPVAVVIAAYVLTLVLFQYLFPALAVLGYTDAWFRYRRRVTKQH